MTEREANRSNVEADDGEARERTSVRNQAVMEFREAKLRQDRIRSRPEQHSACRPENTWNRHNAGENPDH